MLQRTESARESLLVSVVDLDVQDELRLEPSRNEGSNPSSRRAKLVDPDRQQLHGLIGPVLLGMSKPVQIASLGATVNDIVNLGTVAAFDIDQVGT